MSNQIAEIISKGLVTAFAIIFGGLFFKNVKGGVKIPLTHGHKYVSKKKAFIAFIVSIYVVGWFSLWIERIINEFLIKNQTNLILGLLIPLLILGLVFNHICYKK